VAFTGLIEVAGNLWILFSNYF